MVDSLLVLCACRSAMNSRCAHWTRKSQQTQRGQRSASVPHDGDTAGDLCPPPPLSHSITGERGLCLALPFLSSLQPAVSVVSPWSLCSLSAVFSCLPDSCCSRLIVILVSLLLLSSSISASPLSNTDQNTSKVKF